MNSNISNRLGKLTASRLFIEDYVSTIFPNDNILFRDFMPIGITKNPDDTITYMGYSGHFDELALGDKIPEYRCIIAKDVENDIYVYNIMFKRRPTV